ncbi:MAG: hypothetical protein ACOX54_04960 [Christensenellales bacterium]|jgi:hypothetical protein
MAAACRVPITCMETAGEGGPYGMAVLAAYSVQRAQNETLDDYLQNRVFVSSSSVTLTPDEEIVEGFERYLTLFKNALVVEQAAINNI